MAQEKNIAILGASGHTGAALGRFLATQSVIISLAMSADR